MFVDANLNIREDFRLSAEKLASVILKTLSQLNLNINDYPLQGTMMGMYLIKSGIFHNSLTFLNCDKNINKKR